MTEENSFPSISPANTGSLAGTLMEFFKKSLQKTDGQLPAKVIAYDRSRNVATVQPEIAVVTTRGEVIPRPQIAAVPVLSIGGGGFTFNFPIKPGDRGWIMASDRDISMFMQSLSEAAPNTKRLHSFEDGLFVPDVYRTYTIQPGDEDRLVIQSLSGNVRIAIGSDVIRITSSGDIDIVATDKITINATDIAMNSATLTHNTVNIGGTHVHGGVESGGSQTTGPS